MALSDFNQRLRQFMLGKKSHAVLRQVEEMLRHTKAGIAGDETDHQSGNTSSANWEGGGWHKSGAATGLTCCILSTVHNIRYDDELPQTSEG